MKRSFLLAAAAAAGAFAILGSVSATADSTSHRGYSSPARPARRYPARSSSATFNWALG
jgi:hypothetical protein